MTSDAPAVDRPRRSFFRDLSVVHVANAVAAFLFASSGPLAIILATGIKGGLTEAQIASWLFGAPAINGVVSIGYCLYWRQPLVLLWTIPGTVLVGPALGHFSFAEVIGAYIGAWVRRQIRKDELQNR